ncbi:FK506-binding protein 5-like isoform X2 [Triticum urartu]|uniref:FK506-binding protein 5-like isoform X2 n=1 Tax=Triticum urartu TaxID=4572 RepID=UPI002043E0BF|nr:FK506-binding protein 5-like isoform X2 [Triticum urartu]
MEALQSEPETELVEETPQREIELGTELQVTGEMEALQSEPEAELVEETPQMEIELGTELQVAGEIEAPQSEPETELVEETPQMEIELGTELQVAGEMEAPQTEHESELVEETPQIEIEAADGDPTRDEEELPAWYQIFDLNVDGTRESCEVTEIPGDPPEEHASDSLPDLVGQMSQQAYSDPPDTQVQDKRADENQQFEDDQVLLNQGIVMHDLDRNYQNSEQMLINQIADEHGQGDQQQEGEQMLLNNEETMLKQDGEEQVENEQFLPDRAADVNHQIKEEQMLLDHVTVVHDLDHCDLNGEQMLLTDDSVNKSAVDGGQLKDGQMDRAAKRQATLRSLDNGQMMIPIINLDDDDDDDDYAEQPGTREFLEPKSDALHVDNFLPERMCSQDEQAASFPDHQTNIPASSSSVPPHSGNRWTGMGAVNAQGIPSDDGILYGGAFDKIPLVINVWDLPSSELGKS